MKPISTLLFNIYRGTPQHPEWVVACLQGMWPTLLGEGLDRVCRPVAFADGRLRVEILDPGWEEAIRSSAEEIAQRVRAATGDEVRQISYELASAKV
jgi:hypothetical protein